MLCCLVADWHSALMIIVNGETDEHLDMLEGGVIRQLLNDKWKTFARVRLFPAVHEPASCVTGDVLMSTARWFFGGRVVVCMFGWVGRWVCLGQDVYKYVFVLV